LSNGFVYWYEVLLIKILEKSGVLRETMFISLPGRYVDTP